VGRVLLLLAVLLALAGCGGDSSPSQRTPLTIVVNGPFYDAKSSTLSVTGGTGAFRKARGSMRLESRNGGKEYLFTYRLSR
jgi:hypothetical protein